jgi:DNA-binding CsgD family transcriptional regulator
MFSAEKRATIRIFIIDANLNILKGSIPQSTLPAGLRPIVLRLVEQCRVNATGSAATSFCEERIVRVVPMLGASMTYVVSVERYLPYANLLSALKRYRLSPRELDVLMLALEGKTASETAECLNIAISTASDHLNRLLSKTGARNKSNLIAKVLGWSICQSQVSERVAPIVK